MNVHMNANINGRDGYNSGIDVRTKASQYAEVAVRAFKIGDAPDFPATRQHLGIPPSPCHGK